MSKTITDTWKEKVFGFGLVAVIGLYIYLIVLPFLIVAGILWFVSLGHINCSSKVLDILMWETKETGEINEESS